MAATTVALRSGGKLAIVARYAVCIRNRSPTLVPAAVPPLRVTARLAAAALLLVAATVVAAQAAPRAPTAREKAAVVVNFVRYTSWPGDAFSSPGAPYRVCAIGDDAAVSVLARAALTTRISARPMLLQRLSRRGLGSEAAAALAERLRGCHVLFVAADAGAEAAGSLALLAHADVLTVGDVPGFAAAGGMLELVAEGPRLDFRANLAAIADTRLSVSSKVLKLAQLVAQAPP